MNPVTLIPLMLATAAVIYASFARNRNWAVIAFVVWLVIFVLIFFVAK